MVTALFLFLLYFFGLPIHRVIAQNGPTLWKTSPFNPSALPLAVRSPYLNTWAQQGNGPAQVNNLWPTLWNGNITGWYAAVTVDGVAYRVLGDAGITNTTVANQTSVVFTPTQTSFLLSAGPVQINATFLSPIEPTDLVRLSMPFSYLYMTAQSTDGQNHNVVMYSDISAEWISGDDSREVIWSSNITNDHVILQTQLQTQQPFTDFSDHAHDSTAYYCMKAVPNLTWQIGEDIINRGIFSNSSQLQNTSDTNSSFRAVSNDWPVFSIAVNVGAVGSTPSTPIVWSLGVVRETSIQYIGSSASPQQRSAYYWSNFSSAIDVADFFMNDFSRAVSAANAFDAKIQGAGQQISPQYANLLSLSLRQVLGTTEITISKTSSGSWNTSDIMTFMKNMGSAGNTGGVNNVDTLYASFPAFLYLNPALAGYLLRPLLEYQSSSAFNLPYAAQNLGVSYPTATGNSTQHNLGIEESANMIIMALAHAQASGDGSLLSQHFNLFNRWASYLVNNSLSPNSQSSADTDNLSPINQTNLALKGIIGIGAMARICSMAGLSDQSSQYQGIASNYIQQWSSMSTSTDQSHLLMNYGAQSTSGLMYNLFADKLLNLSLVSNAVYEVQQSFYITAAPQVKFGLPLDSSDAQLSRSDWMMFSAASTGDQSTINLLLNQLILYASANIDNRPFSSIYDPTTAKVSGGVNSPGQGSMFALLALQNSIQSPSVNPALAEGPTTKKKSHAGAIAGAVVGSLAGICIVAVGIFFFLRHRRRSGDQQMAYVQSDYASKPALSPLGHSDVVAYEPFRRSRERVVSGDGSAERPSVYYSDFRPSVHSNGVLAYDQGTFIEGRYGTGPSLSASELGPSASQVGPVSSVTSDSRSTDNTGTTSRRSGRTGSSQTSNPMMVKQSLVNEELRNEVENLRREMERIREERAPNPEEAPPSYVDLS